MSCTRQKSVKELSDTSQLKYRRLLIGGERVMFYWSNVTNSLEKQEFEY